MSGQANPYDIGVYNPPTYINGTYQNKNGLISINDSLRIGAARLVVKGNNTPILHADSMSLVHWFDGTNTNMFIFSPKTFAFTGDMVEIGSAEIISIEMADFQGTLVDLALKPAY